jgi:pilus assembly protein Flp/PilA
MKFITKLARNEEGATAIEYGLIAALIAVAIMTTVSGLGGSLKTTFSSVGSGLNSANSSAG